MGISNLIYSLSCVVSSKGDLHKAQQIVNDFIWKQKPANIKHNVLIGPCERSGIRAPDLIIMQKIPTARVVVPHLARNILQQTF